VNLQLREQPPEFSWQYGAVPIAFEVRERLAVEMIANGMGGVRLTRCAVEEPYTKDYDALPGQAPENWSKQWDLSGWCLCAAFCDDEHVGGVAMVIDTRQVNGSRHDIDEAVLWDVRVCPEQRRRRVGRQLLAFAEHRARLAGKLRLSVETQNVNVPACQLYASSGFSLRSLNRSAYPLLPDEVQLVWSKSLSGPESAR
jgi:GNAT superfamily N-acetyltransferase